ncbi:MAG: M24 family metallopeptidase [Leptolyngbyaceae cyanobacterium bins.349]|nr:M24 family metallopeptidase [Leptolyngbyaceae cyanobacterium bins.349]
MKRSQEITTKLQLMRQALAETGSAGVRLRGTDWFAWATAGGANTVLLAAETGVAEVLVTTEAAWILTDEIEAQRLQDEEISTDAPYHFHIMPWAQADKRATFVQAATGNGKVISDRPTATEAPLPPALIRHQRILNANEIDRYRQVGHLASAAMTEVLHQAQPDWTEQQLAGAGANALWSRGLHPALILAAGDRRLPLYRHPLPQPAPLGRQAMLVFCARGFGLIISLTRFVFFEPMSEQERQLHRTIAEIEAIALNHSQPDTPLNTVYHALANAYEQHGFPQAILEHHQGGTAGYGAREVIATPATNDVLMANMAIAWNPSLPGAKIEDTFVVHSDGRLENLSFDPNFPQAEIAGRLRAIPLERT